LAFLDLAGHHCNGAILVDVQSCRHGGGLAVAAAAKLPGDRDTFGHRDKKPRTEQLDKGTSA
jgi:hypothetical protein